MKTKLRRSILAAILLFSLLFILVGQMSVRAQGFPDTIWLTKSADVNWNGTNENVYLVINDGTLRTSSWSLIPNWRAPFIMADGTLSRYYMGIFNLREQVYWKDVRELDEGWWDTNGQRQGYLYETKSTISGPPVQTTWKHTWSGTDGGKQYTKSVTLIRKVHEFSFFLPWPRKFYGFVVEYEVWFFLKVGSFAKLPWLAGHVGFAATWHENLESGTAATSLTAITGAMAKVQSTIMTSYDFKGIIDPDLKFVISYTFDDSMKIRSIAAKPNTALIGWDGLNCGDFLAMGINYEDSTYSPLTADTRWYPSGSAAIFGMVIRQSWLLGTAPPPTILMDNCMMSGSTMIGVGPTGLETQRVYVAFTKWIPCPQT